MKAPLVTAAQNAQSEREQIRESIAIMEALVGEATGTQSDQAGADFVLPDALQQDCIDETINTSLYLTLLQEEGLLRWHQVDRPTRRGFLVDGRWPHNSAVIKEKASQTRYVVDSWFFENGKKPVIITEKEWLKGWAPEAIAPALKPAR